VRQREIRPPDIYERTDIYEEIVIYGTPAVPVARFAKHELAIAVGAATSITPA
jgi:hypothetical protein